PGAAVLAADTIAWIDGQVVVKPVDEADARRILRLLGGREHELWTGVCLWQQPIGLLKGWKERSRAFFQALSDEELASYLHLRQWQGCSGAYAIQETEDDYIRIVEGSVTNVIGLPMESLTEALDNLDNAITDAKTRT